MGEGVDQAVADVGRPADAVYQAGLDEARDAECGGGEDYSEGGVWADEEVLLRDQCHDRKQLSVVGWGVRNEHTF